MKQFCRFLRYSPYIIVEYKREGLDNMEDKKKNEEIKNEKTVDTKLDEGIELSDNDLELVSGGNIVCKPKEYFERKK